MVEESPVVVAPPLLVAVSACECEDVEAEPVAIAEGFDVATGPAGSEIIDPSAEKYISDPADAVYDENALMSKVLD